MDVGAWLSALRLGQYAAAFTESHVDQTVIDAPDDADLKELGVSSLGHRKKLLAAIAARAS